MAGGSRAAAGAASAQRQSSGPAEARSRPRRGHRNSSVARLVTIVGPGGIGKTTVAIAAAEQMSGSFADGIWFVGLATLVDAALVPTAIGAALGIPSTRGDPLTALAAWSRDKRMLIVLDCCACRRRSSC